MNEFTNTEIDWFIQLEILLSKRPTTVEILVQESFNNSRGIQSKIHLMKEGVIYESQQQCDDLMAYDPSQHSISSFSVNGLAANNHGY